MELSEARKQIEEIDAKMAQLFEQRMALVMEIGAYKREHGLPILDRSREEALLEKNLGFISDSTNLQLYHEFQTKVMELSKKKQM